MMEKRERMRAHPLCECCDTAKAQDGHHPFGQNGRRIMVFVVVCRKCHDRIHGNGKWARTEGWVHDSISIRYHVNVTVMKAVKRASMPELLR